MYTAHCHTVHLFCISFPGANLSHFSLLTHYLPPEGSANRNNVLHCALHCGQFALSSSLCWHWEEKTVQPSCHQWATSGQPVGAKRVTQCSFSVPCRTTRRTTRLPKCSQPHNIWFQGDGVVICYSVSKCTWYYGCWTAWSSILRVPNSHTVEQCFIANAPICSNLHLVLQARWYCRCITLHPLVPCIAGMVVLEVHNAPSYPLATDQLSPECIFSPVCILPTFSPNLRLHTCHQCWTLFARNCAEYCTMCSLTAFSSNLRFCTFLWNVTFNMQLVLCTQSKYAG